MNDYTFFFISSNDQFLKKICLLVLDYGKMMWITRYYRNNRVQIVIYFLVNMALLSQLRLQKMNQLLLTSLRIRELNSFVV